MVSEFVPQFIKNSKNLAIFINDFDDVDLVVSAISLALMVKEDGKDVDIITSHEVSGKYISKFADYGLSIKTQLLPQRYVVRIDYSKTPIEKVTYEPDEKNGKLNFYIIPKEGAFSFDDIEYIKEGVGYDALIFLGLKSPKELGDMYDNGKDMFDSSKIIAFSRSNNFPADNVIELKKNNTFSEAIYFTAIKYFDAGIFDAEIATLLLLGVLDKSGLLEGFVTNENQKLIGNLIALGGDLNKALKMTYFSKDNSNTILQLKYGQQVKFDFENGISFAVINHEDLKQAEIKSETEIDVKGRLINNMSKEISFACIAYEISPERLWVIIQADGEKYSAKKFAQVFEGKGNDKGASCIIENTSIDEFRTVLYSVMGDLFGVKKSVIEKSEATKNSTKTIPVIEAKKVTADKTEMEDKSEYPY